MLPRRLYRHAQTQTQTNNKKKKKPNVFHVSEIWTVTKVTGLCPKMEKTKDQGRVMEALNNTHAHTR